MNQIIGRIILAGTLVLSLSACGVRYYPMVSAEPSAALEARSCHQLQEDLQIALRVKDDIARIEADARSNGQDKPKLYSTKKSDADASSAARIASLSAVMTYKNCPAA